MENVEHGVKVIPGVVPGRSADGRKSAHLKTPPQLHTLIIYDCYREYAAWI